MDPKTFSFPVSANNETRNQPSGCGDDRLAKDEEGQVRGAVVKDLMTGEVWEIATKAVVNATGCFCDSIR